MSIDSTDTADLTGFERALADAEAATGPLGDLSREAAGADIQSLRLLRRSVDRAVFADDASHTVIRAHGTEFDDVLDNRGLVQAAWSAGAPVVPSTGCAYDDDLLVTSWPQGEPPDPKGVYELIGSTLRQLHAKELTEDLAEKTPQAVQHYRSEIAQRISALPEEIPEDVQTWLYNLVERAEEPLEILESSAQEQCLVHLDAHPGNVIDMRGQGLLIDLDTLTLGIPELSLLPCRQSARYFDGGRWCWTESISGYGMPNTLNMDLLDKLLPIRLATQQLWLANLWNISRRHRRELVMRMRVMTEGSDKTFTAL